MSLRRIPFKYKLALSISFIVMGVLAGALFLFETLIDADRSYTAQSKSGLVDGQILFVGTDGIWEARNAAGEMFGKDRLYVLLRRHAGGSAQAIAGAVLDQLRQFKGGEPDFEDDVTLVVVKLIAGLAAK